MHKFSYIATACLTLFLTTYREQPTFPEVAPPAMSHPLPSSAPLPLTDGLRAIVQLQDLELPPPQTTGEATIPLRVLTGTRVFVLDLAIGGRTGTFLFDIGASTSMLSTPTVKDLGLQGKALPQELLTSAVAGDECETMNANLHPFPPLTRDSLRIEGLQGLEFTDVIIPGRLDGVLGMDVLGHYDLQVDPRQRMLTMLASGSNPELDLGEAVPLKERLGVLLVQVEINGEGPFTFLIDNGADRMFISQGLAELLELGEEDRSPIQIQGFCGLESAQATVLSRVKLAQHEQGNLDAIILASPVLKLLEVDGIVGQNFLNEYQQYWRFDRDEVEGKLQGGRLLLTPYPTR
ncbi:aspartyl protease family protein [Spirulina subsalsa]|uniref:aspartyl protease family protein n=1 Tax=Spirulina subsalsa TaxID=54311 RepID=UPI0013DE8CDF|nr:retropepsin-like aspartic protease [Spirulina subsalsa]